MFFSSHPGVRKYLTASSESYVENARKNLEGTLPGNRTETSPTVAIPLRRNITRFGRMRIPFT